MKLYAGRFENDDTEAALLEQFADAEAIGVRWSLADYGVQRIEVTVAAKNQYDAYDRYKNHLGQRLAVYGGDLYRPISGNITSVEWLPGDKIRYVAKGAYNRLYDHLNTNKYDATDGVSDTLEVILSNHVDVMDGTTDNITGNSTPLDGWQPTAPQGQYPGDSIRELLAMSDSVSRIYDFWLVDQTFSGTSLRQHTPHYHYREDDAGPDWIVSRKDLSSLTLSRDIDDFATQAFVWYGLVTGTATSGSDTTLTDTGKNFIAAGVQAGDTVTNVTKAASCRVVSVTANTLTIDGPTIYRGQMSGGSTTTLIGGAYGDNPAVNFVTEGVSVGDVVINDTDDSKGTITSISTTTTTNDTLNISGAMSGGFQNDAGERYRIVAAFAASDDYSIRTKAQTKRVSAATSTTPYWSRGIAVFETAMNEDAASEYVNILADTEAQQRQSFVIGSQFIRDANGALHPLWDVIATGGGYIQISDLYPAAALSSTSRDRLTTFRITALDYDNTSGNLRVSVDTLDTRLDARLRRANILNSEIVSRYQ